MGRKTLFGVLSLATVHRGTRSEHTGIVLDTSGGERLILVRLGANPFDDEETRKLDGRSLEVDG